MKMASRTNESDSRHFKITHRIPSKQPGHDIFGNQGIEITTINRFRPLNIPLSPNFKRAS
jgi:hypothetical protein